MDADGNFKRLREEGSATAEAAEASPAIGVADFGDGDGKPESDDARQQDIDRLCQERIAAKAASAPSSS